MRISTLLPELTPACDAWLIGQALLGLAKGCAPLLSIWRLPKLYDSGVVYRLEPNHGSGEEDFALPWQVYARGWGDCDDLIIWRTAELRAAGTPAVPHAKYERGEIHMVVRVGSRFEDPSKILIEKER